MVRAVEKKMIHWTHDLTAMLALFRAYEAVDPEGQPTVSMLLRANSPGKRIGILPSSFNPPTMAHLGLVAAAKQHLALDEVVLSLGKVIVEKKLTGLTPADRLLALCAVSRKRDDLSIAIASCGLYVEMGQAYQRAYPGSELYFLMDFDKIEQIFDPKYYQDRDASLRALFSTAKIAVASRGDHGQEALRALLQKPENQTFAAYVSHLPLDPTLAEISSTQVRQQAQEKKFNPREIPKDVVLLLRETFAYQTPKPFLQESLDLYQLRSDLVQRAAASQTAGGDLAPLLERLCERSEAGAARRTKLLEGVSWEELVPYLL
jgi:nicotinic acid mononucleotide adenylyltransferase